MPLDGGRIFGKPTVKRIDDKSLAGSGTRVVFEHEWRADFVGEALTLDLDAGRQLTAVEFYSARLGVVRWTAGSGLGVARTWESEEDAGRGLAGPRAALLDGATHDLTSLAIVDSVLEHLDGTELCGIVRAVLKQPQLPRVITAETVDLFAEVPGTQLDESNPIGLRLRRAMVGLLGG